MRVSRSARAVLVILVAAVLLSGSGAGASLTTRHRGTGGVLPGGGVSAATPGASPTPSAQPFDAYLARIPQFPAPPPPQPTRVPVGPKAGWFARIETDQPVAFITIDDGWLKLPIATALLRAAHVPVTLFLTVNAIRDNHEYFRELQASGADIQAHTVTHVGLRGKAYGFQKREVCGSADQLAAWYGRRPTLFRPPFGEFDATTLRAVRDCGMKAAFFWRETVHQGVIRYQQGNTLQRGDIILMHFRPAFAEDFLAVLTAIHAAGLVPAALERYVDS